MEFIQRICKKATKSQDIAKYSYHSIDIHNIRMVAASEKEIESLVRGF